MELVVKQMKVMSRTTCTTQFQLREEMGDRVRSAKKMKEHEEYQSIVDILNDNNEKIKRMAVDELLKRAAKEPSANELIIKR